MNDGRNDEVIHVQQQLKTQSMEKNCMKFYTSGPETFSQSPPTLSDNSL